MNECPCCPQLGLHHPHLSCLPWNKKDVGQALFRASRMAEGLTVSTSHEEQSQTRPGVPCSLVSKPCSGTLFLREALQVSELGQTGWDRGIALSLPEVRDC